MEKKKPTSDNRIRGSRICTKGENKDGNNDALIEGHKHFASVLDYSVQKKPTSLIKQM